MAEILDAVRIGFSSEMYTVAKLIKTPNAMIQGWIRFTSPFSTICFI